MDPVTNLTPQDWEGAAWYLRCELAAIRAVAEVETGAFGAFYPDGRPMILFERHLFHRFTHGDFDSVDSELSNPIPGGYGSVTQQPIKLERASKLSREAALRACSWGAFQILGDNYAACGFGSLQAFVNSMYAGIDEHLRAFVTFVRHDVALLVSLRHKDWGSFKRFYNGPAPNGYTERLAAAYDKWRVP